MRIVIYYIVNMMNSMVNYLNNIDYFVLVSLASVSIAISSFFISYGNRKIVKRIEKRIVPFIEQTDKKNTRLGKENAKLKKKLKRKLRKQVIQIRTERKSGV